mgnify:FL=1
MYLWFFVLRAVTRLAFQPPLEEENEFIPVLENQVYRHEFVVKEGFREEKEFAVKGFFGKAEAVSVLHDNTLIAMRMKELAKTKCVKMLVSLLQDYDWDVLVYARPILRFLNQWGSGCGLRCSDADEASRDVLISRGVTYMSENRWKSVGVMKLQGWIEW